MKTIKTLLRPFYVRLITWFRLKKLHLKYPLHIMTSSQTLSYIQKHKCSIARFGDGEFSLAFDSDSGIHFQEASEALSGHLQTVLCEENDALLVCIPRPLKSVRGMNEFASKYWRAWTLNQNHYQTIASVIHNFGRSHFLFGDSFITRPYIDWKSPKHAIVFEKLKSLWKSRDLLVVEGSQTRLGIGNDLFSEANSVKRILAPTLNAFSRYSEILQAVISSYHGELVLIALGPTATVLASDLSKHGIQALDVGHVDIEYMWYQMKAQKKVPIPGKYTNECWDGHTFSECTDPQYLMQIIGEII